METRMDFHDKHFARKRCPINSRSPSKSWEKSKSQKVRVYLRNERAKGEKKGDWRRMARGCAKRASFFPVLPVPPPPFDPCPTHYASRNLVYDTDARRVVVNDPLSYATCGTRTIEKVSLSTES